MRLRDINHALDAAPSYERWLEAAREHDRLTGMDDWRADDRSPHFDTMALRQSIDRLRVLRQSGDVQGLTDRLTEDLYRHQQELAAPDLYTTAMAGPKHIVERYLDEAEASLRALAEAPGIPLSDRLKRFERAWAVYGRTALLLSGGATWGFHHLGVVKALFAHDLLPDILSGASTGAMIAAGVCTRTDAELAQMFAHPDTIRLDGLALLSPTRAWGQRALLDPDRLRAVLRHNVGDWTFAQAWRRSGRALNIAVSPTRTRQKPRLLTHLTAPDVVVAQAALASSALPGLFPPIELTQHPGDIEEPYIPGERWVDGSLSGDLPMRRLSRLHNVNHFIVSQTNPHVVPFLHRTPVTGLVSATLRGQGGFATDVLRRASPPNSHTLRRLTEQAHQLVTQDYRGDIDIHPRLRWSLLRKVVANPSREDLACFIREGERSVWPLIPLIHGQTRLGRAFRDCVGALRVATRTTDG